MMRPSSSSNSLCIMAISGSEHRKTRFAALCKRGSLFSASIETVMQDARVLEHRLKIQVISAHVDSMQPTS